jgi:hypothetical protein
MDASLHIHLRGFFSSITPHVAAAVIPPSATSSKTSSGIPIGVIRREFEKIVKLKADASRRSTSWEP